MILQAIAHAQDNPDDLVYEKFYNSAFKDQPLGKTILGTSKTLETFNRDYFLKFTGKALYAENVYLSIAGNIDHYKIIKEAENLFYSL